MNGLRKGRKKMTGRISDVDVSLSYGMFFPSRVT